MTDEKKVLTDDEKEQALQNYESALVPRTEDGLIVPMVFQSDRTRELYYPHFRTDGETIDPMVFLEEWVNGIPPGKLEYLSGIQPSGLTPDDPDYLDRIIYKDPVLNLPFEQQLLLRKAEESLGQAKKMKVVVKRGDEILCQSGEADKGEDKPELLLDSGKKSSSDQPIVVPLPSGEMRCKIGDKEVTLANFSVKAVEHQIWLRPDRPKEGESKFVIRLLTQGKTQDILLGVKDIENVIGVIQRKMPECYVNPSVGKAQILVSNYIRDQLGSLPERLYVGKSGFIKIHETWVFAHDGAILPNPDVVFRTGRTIARKPEMTAKEAFQAAMGFLEVSDKDALIIPLFLVAHLSPMFNLFSAAGHIPRFVTFLSGRTGSMKTSLSLALFRLFQEQLSSPEASFKDTETALEIKLGEGNGKVILLDDYRPPVTSQDGKANLAKLESVVRAAGDRIGKSRSNAELGKAREFLPSSCVVVTGEDLGGSQSTQLRMLILSISKGDVKGEVLKRYQDDPLLISTHMFYFLEWAGKNAERIIGFIARNFQDQRNRFERDFKEARSVDNSIILSFTASILCMYGNDIGGIEPGMEMTTLSRFGVAIGSAGLESEAVAQGQNPVCMYLKAFFEMLEQKDIRIAPDIDCYEAGVHVGYAEDGCLWYYQNKVFAQVVNYWKRLNVLFPLTCEKTNEHLYGAGLIMISQEKRDGKIKRLYSCRSSLQGRPRLMVLDQALARNYLENEE